MNAATLQEVLRTGYVSTRGDIGSGGTRRRPLVEKTVADILSDVLAMRRGDAIFPWVVHGEDSPNTGFGVELKVADPPVFVPGDRYPVKVPLEREYLVYERAVEEEEALDLFEPRLLWNAIGKKSLGRGRSVTHQTPAEDDTLRLKLGGSNVRQLARTNYENAIPVTIDLSQGSDKLGDYEAEQGIWRFHAEDRLRRLKLRNVQWTAGDHVKAEKVLEAWLMEHMDDPVARPLGDILPRGARIIWFANYLPFGVTGRNIDVVVVFEQDGRESAAVVELKRDALDDNGLASAISEAGYYTRFVAKAIFAGDLTRVHTVILAHASTDSRCGGLGPAHGLPNPPVLAGYTIRNGRMSMSTLQ